MEIAVDTQKIWNKILTLSLYDRNWLKDKLIENTKTGDLSIEAIERELYAGNPLTKEQYNVWKTNHKYERIDAPYTIGELSNRVDEAIEGVKRGEVVSEDESDRQMDALLNTFERWEE